MAAAWTRQSASALELPRAPQFASSGGASGRDARRAQELAERGIEPGAEVDAVRDVADRRLLAGPQDAHISRATSPCSSETPFA